MKPKDLFLEVLPTETKEAFQKLQEFNYLQNSNWYLAGGTGLALQVGHRQSVDLFWYCSQSKRGEGLDALISRTMDQYQMQEGHEIHLLKSLVYFDDAETDPLPRVNFPIQWGNVKSYFNHEVTRILQYRSLIT